jgi:hypothetical protein
MENHAKYGELIYAYSGTALYVNLFIASELTWPARGMAVRQETAFPEEPATHLRIQTQQPLNLTVKLRQPEWCRPGITLKVNGSAIDAAPDASGYVSITREWRDGDTIDVGLPMTLRTEPLPGSPAIVAVFDGPILLAGALGTGGMPTGGQFAPEQQQFRGWPTPPETTLVGDPAGIPSALKPVAGEALTFRTDGIGRPRDVTLLPFYRLHHQRYTIYWQTDSVSHPE